jgi:hypothetical protein
MAVLGRNGIVRLRRDAPSPIVLPVSSARADIDVLLVSSQEFWNGDEVRIFAPSGLPLSTTTLPGGVGCYFGSFWELGSNRTHVTAEDDEYYVTGDNSVYFYNQGVPVNTATYYIYRDKLDRVSFYDTRAKALKGLAADRIDIRQLDFQYLVIAAAGTEEYDNALTECIAAVGEYRLSDVTDEVTLESICDFPPLFLQPVAGTAEYDDAELSPRRWVNGFPWIVQGLVEEWSIELDASSINTTSVGDKFGENIKSIVSGGGSFDFYVDRQSENPESTNDNYDVTSLMQLLLLTEKGCKAQAQFYMIFGREDVVERPELLPGDLFYECDILITNNAINTRADSLIVGTANFVTTGPIQLRMGT